MPPLPSPGSAGGFAPPADRRPGQGRRSAALAELIASTALAVSIVVVVATVSLGLARADALFSPELQQPSAPPSSQSPKFRAN